MWLCCPEHSVVFTERADTNVLLLAPVHMVQGSRPVWDAGRVWGQPQQWGRESSAVEIAFAAHFGFSTGCFPFAQPTENLVAETRDFSHEQHRKLEHPDVFLQGSLPSGLFYRPAMNTHRFDLISPYDHPFHLSFIADCLAELSANPFKVTQHKFGAVCELCFLSRSD